MFALKKEKKLELISKRAFLNTKINILLMRKTIVERKKCSQLLLFKIRFNLIM